MDPVIITTIALAVATSALVTTGSIGTLLIVGAALKQND